MNENQEDKMLKRIKESLKTVQRQGIPGQLIQICPAPPSLIIRQRLTSSRVRITPIVCLGIVESELGSRTVVAVSDIGEFVPIDKEVEGQPSVMFEE